MKQILVMLSFTLLCSTVFADNYYWIGQYPAGATAFPPSRMASIWSGANTIQLTLTNGALMGSGLVIWNLLFFENPGQASRGPAMDLIMTNPLTKIGGLYLQCTNPISQYSGSGYVQNWAEVGVTQGQKNCFFPYVTITQ